MARNEGSDSPATTELDLKLAPRRLKEGLVPPKTGIFLRIEEGPGAGRTMTLSAGGVHVIGREGADIALEDKKVSRKHAEIGLYGPGAYLLRDLASTNGTLLNGKRVGNRAKLRHWDLIHVGDTVLRISFVEDAIPIA